MIFHDWNVLEHHRCFIQISWLPILRNHFRNQCMSINYSKSFRFDRNYISVFCVHNYIDYSLTSAGIFRCSIPLSSRVAHNTYIYNAVFCYNRNRSIRLFGGILPIVQNYIFILPTFRQHLIRTFNSASGLWNDYIHYSCVRNRSFGNCRTIIRFDRTGACNVLNPGICFHNAVYSLCFWIIEEYLTSQTILKILHSILEYLQKLFT